jgi:hypothetical protein
LLAANSSSRSTMNCREPFSSRIRMQRKKNELTRFFPVYVGGERRAIKSEASVLFFKACRPGLSRPRDAGVVSRGLFLCPRVAAVSLPDHA